MLATWPALLGMGTTGGRDVMKPRVDFHATLVDKGGTRIEVSRVNVGGQIELAGKLGRGDLRIPFENIAYVEFRNESRRATVATIHLKEGEAVKLSVRGSLTFYGQTPMGMYQVRARDLQRLDFAKGSDPS